MSRRDYAAYRRTYYRKHATAVLIAWLRASATGRRYRVSRVPVMESRKRWRVTEVEAKP